MVVFFDYTDYTKAIDEFKIEQTKFDICYCVCTEKHPNATVELLASEMIKKGCREAIFRGKYEDEWHRLFDEVYIDQTDCQKDEDVFLTSSADCCLYEFADQIAITETGENVCVFYDDESIALYIREALKTRIEESVCFETPLCHFSVFDEGGQKVPFDVYPLYLPTAEVYIDNDPLKIVPAANFGGGVIGLLVETEKAEREWFIKSDRPLKWRGSGERVVFYGRTEKNRTMAISLPEEDFIYIEQQDPYTLTLCVKPNRTEFVFLRAAWALDIADHMEDYEVAVESWVY